MLPDSASKPPPTKPYVDPTMQGGGTTKATTRTRERTSEDVALGPKVGELGAPRGPASGPGGNAGTSAPLMLLKTPDQYVDPLLVQRLLAKARTGYGGTFLTGPRGVVGGG
jgi:hypothetical protein